MRIGVIGDVHLGINENKYLFNKYHLKCIKYIFSRFKRLGIKKIIYLGDIFDKRYSISVKTLKQAEDLFQNDFEQYFLLGNHDVTYKNSNKLNSVEILLGDKNKVVVDTPEELVFDNKKFLLVPWINKTNIKKTTEIVEQSEADYMFGHLDLVGFEMISGFVSTTGHFNISLLRNFIHVISGHYHCYSNKKNVTYLGSVSQMTWNDNEVQKYCGYIDTKNDKLNLIEIPYHIYKVIRIKSEDDIKNVEQYKDKIVKCYLYTKRNIKIEKFITDLVDIAQTVNVIDEQVINATIDFEISEHNMSIPDLWEAYLENMEIPKKDSVIVDKIFKDVYTKVCIGDVD